MKLSVLVASYNRPLDLERCLRGLHAQTRPAEEIIVVLRDTDLASQTKLAAVQAELKLPLRHLLVSKPGVLAANNLALPETKGELLSFIDDDACPEPAWLQKIEAHFQANPKLGALGGRDRFAHPLMIEETERSTKEVGRIRWYGKIVNYHHRRFEGVAPADSLKGCNMTFRRSLISRCDEKLGGNACYYELDLCFRVKKQGFEILFDGNLLVDHYLSDSHLDRFRRGELHPDRVHNDYHNRARVLLGHLRGPRWWVAAGYWLVLEPNVAALRFLRHRYPEPISCWKRAIQGSWQGYLSLRADKSTITSKSL